MMVRIFKPDPRRLSFVGNLTGCAFADVLAMFLMDFPINCVALDLRICRIARRAFGFWQKQLARLVTEDKAI